MHLFFLRHGKAEDWHPGITDAQRRLTEAGIAEMQVEAKNLAALDLRIDFLFTSPYPRALETAHIVAEAMQLAATQFRIVPELSAGSFGLGMLQSLVTSLPENGRVMFVGHEPDLSSTAGLLTGGAQIVLKKGGLIYVEIIRPEPDSGVLRWLLSPRHLTRTSEE